MESLESRELLAARVFVDFGDSFSGGNLLTNNAQWSSTSLTPTPGAKGVNFNTHVSGGVNNFLVQKFDTVATANGFGSQLSALKTAIIDQVAKYFEPFDVSVVANSASSVAGVRTALDTTDGSGDNDTYVVVGSYQRETSLGSGVYSPFTFPSGVVYGIAPIVDVSNGQEDTVSVFADTMFNNITDNTLTGMANSIAWVIAHEVGHSFGLSHTITPASTAASSDIMSEYADEAQITRNDNFFSRVEMNLVAGGTANNHDKLITNLGSKPLSFSENIISITGSGGAETITISYVSSSIKVEVSAATSSESNGTPTPYYIGHYSGVGPYFPMNIIIQGGAGNDIIRFDSSLLGISGTPVSFQVLGGSGSGDKVEFIGTSGSESIGFTPASSTVDGRIEVIAGKGVSFDASTEQVDYLSNGGNDVVNATTGALTQLAVRNNTSTGNVTVKATGTSNADNVTFFPSAGGAVGSLTVGSNLPVLFDDKVFAVEYYTNGGDDDIFAYSGTTNEFTAIKTGTGVPLLGVFGTGGSDVVTMQGQVGVTPGYISFNGAGPKNVKFTGIDYVVYDTNYGSDVVYASNTNNNYFGISKSGTGNVVLATYGTTSADTVTITGQTSTVPGSVSFASGSKPVQFFGVDQVNYNTSGGADVVYTANSTYQTFQVAKSGANPGTVTVATYGTTGTDTVVMTGQVSTTPGSVVFSGGTSKPVYFLDVDQVNYSSSGGSDVIHTANNTKQVFHVSKTGANPGTVTVATYGTTGADSVYIAGQVGSTAGFVQFGGTSKSVYFVGVDQVNYSSQGGNDVVTVVPGLVQEFSILKTGASGNVTVATSGTSSNDDAYIVGTATGSVHLVLNGVTQKKINLYNIAQINYATQGGSDTIHYTHGVSNVYILNPGATLLTSSGTFLY